MSTSMKISKCPVSIRFWSKIFKKFSIEVSGHVSNQIHGATALKSQDQLMWLLPDGSTGDLVVSKALSLNLNFSFLNQISLLLISSSYPIGLTRLGGPHSRSYTSRKIRYGRELNLGPLGWQSDVLTTIPNRQSQDMYSNFKYGFQDK